MSQTDEKDTSDKAPNPLVIGFLLLSMFIVIASHEISISTRQGQQLSLQLLIPILDKFAGLILWHSVCYLPALFFLILTYIIKRSKSNIIFALGCLLGCITLIFPLLSIIRLYFFALSGGDIDGISNIYLYSRNLLTSWGLTEGLAKISVIIFQIISFIAGIEGCIALYQQLRKQNGAK